MNLFIFRLFEGPKTANYDPDNLQNVMYALHPTQRTITDAEWSEMLEETEALFRADKDHYMRSIAQSYREMSGEDRGAPFTSGRDRLHLYRRMRELETSYGMPKSLSEVLETKGFMVITPQKRSYQIPEDEKHL